MKNKVFSCIIGFYVLIALTASAEAATIVRTGETVSVQNDQRVDGNFYLLAGTASLSGPVDGDVVAAAGTVSINAPVLHDVLVLGGTVGVNATVTEDVRIVAGDVTLANTVEGSVFVLGGRLKILSTATIKGDVLFIGGEATVEGDVEGSLLGYAEKVRVDSGIGGGIDMKVVQLVLGDNANVNADVAYTSQSELERAPGATVTGSIVRNDVMNEITETNSARTIAIAFLVSLFGSLLTYLVLKNLLETYFVPRVIDPLWPIFAGGGFLLLAPLLVVILLVSMIGVSLGLILLAGSLTMLALAFVLANMTAGVLASYIVTKKPVLNTMTITIGAVITQALFFVPVIGPLLLMVLFCLTVGALVLILAAKIAHRR